jgi:hypothetical protein
MCFGVVENVRKMFNNDSRHSFWRPRCHIIMQCSSWFRNSRKLSVCDATRSGRPSILTEKKVLDISDRMLGSPKKSIRKLSQQVGVSYGTAHSFKKRLRLQPYKITAVHELKPGDSVKRVAYYKWFLEFPDHEGEDIFDVTFFTDEAYFHLGTSTVKTHLSGVHINPMRSTSHYCMMRSWCLGWNVT